MVLELAGIFPGTQRMPGMKPGMFCGSAGRRLYQMVIPDLIYVDMYDGWVMAELGPEGHRSIL